MTYQLVAFFEADITTLWAVLSDLLFAVSTQSLIALETVIGVCYQVEAD